MLDNLITGQKRFVHPQAIFEWCDITHSEGAIEYIFKKHGVEYVFNYAAEPYIPLSFSRPLHVLDINTRGALLVMNAAHDCGVKGMLQVSSAEIYGHGFAFPLGEDSSVLPHSTYGASKAAADYLVQVRWREAGTPVMALRQFNCVGERETHPYIIPEIIKQVQVAKERGEDHVQVYLGNDSTRDFQYAGDAVAMAVELLEKGEFGEVYNMGSEDVITMYKLAELIGSAMGVVVTVVEDEARKRPWEIWHLQSNNAKIYGVINYRPKVKLYEAVANTIKWFHGNGDRWDF